LINFKTGDAVQRGADPQRVGWAKERCPLVFCELEPGDAIFFHCNLLHTSDQVHLVTFLSMHEDVVVIAVVITFLSLNEDIDVIAVLFQWQAYSFSSYFTLGVAT